VELQQLYADGKHADILAQVYDQWYCGLADF